MDIRELEKEILEKSGWLTKKLSEQRSLVVAYANSEEAYRVALAKEMYKMKESGEKVTILSDLARGNEVVAGLKRERDIAEGVLDACKSAIRSMQSTMSALQSLISTKKEEMKLV